MDSKIKQTPVTNLNPVLSVSKDGTILYSNQTSNPMLDEWGVIVGEKLPSFIGDIVQRVISQKSPEKIEIKVGNKLYLAVFHPVPKQECISISGFEINEPKQIEETLQESKGKYQLILDTAYEGIVIAALDGRYTYVNRRMADMLGYPVNEILGKFSSDFTFDKCLPSVYKIRTGLEEGRSIQGEFKYRRKDGSVLWTNYSTTAVYDDEGKHVANVGMHTDITERKRIEKALRESEKRHSFLLKLSDELRPLSNSLEIQSTAAGVLGEYLSVSRVAYGEVTDDDTYIVLERNYVAVGVPLVTGRFRMIDFGPNLLSALNEGRTIAVPNMATATELSEDERAAYASLGIASLIGVPLNKRGRFIAELIIHDTEPRQWTQYEIVMAEETAERTWAAIERAKAEEALKESEERFRTLSETSPIGVGVSSAESKIIYTNPSYDRILGYNTGELIGRTSTDFYWNPEEKKSWYHTLRDMGIVRDFEIRLKKKDGTPVWVSINTSPIFFGGRKEVMSTVQDINDHKKAEKELRESELKYRALSNTLEERIKERTEELEEAYTSLRDIETVRKQEIHHRIKNNLQVISSLLDLQAEKFRGKKNIKIHKFWNPSRKVRIE